MDSFKGGGPPQVEMSDFRDDAGGANTVAPPHGGMESGEIQQYLDHLRVLETTQSFKVQEVVPGKNCITKCIRACCCPRRTKHYVAIDYASGGTLMEGDEFSNKYCEKCLGPQRAFQVVFTDSQGNPVMYIDRPFRLNLCGLWHRPEVHAMSPDGVFEYGMIEMKPRVPWKYRDEFEVYFGNKEDEDNEPVGEIHIQPPNFVQKHCRCIPCVAICCRHKPTFNYMDNEEHELGQVIKERDKRFGDPNMDAFSINVTPGLPVDQRALLVASTILFDFLYFEGDQGKN